METRTKLLLACATGNGAGGTTYIALIVTIAAIRKATAKYEVWNVKTRKATTVSEIRRTIIVLARAIGEAQRINAAH
jgi:ABC-type molybdenum transport system ATPase subunit/photorepair protein PhrA